MITRIYVRIYDDCNGHPCQEPECSHDTVVVTVSIEGLEYAELAQDTPAAIRNALTSLVWAQYVFMNARFKNWV